MDEKYIRSIKADWSKVDSDSYLRSIPSLNKLEELTFHKNITIFAGTNGAGKSTLLEAIAVAWGFNPEGGTKNYDFSTRDTHSELHKALTIVKGSRQPKSNFFLRAESFYNVASKFDDYGLNECYDQSLHNQSHGESFLWLTQSTFRENGLYLLDEAESALSPQRQLTLLYSIHKLAQSGAQFIIATHSPILLAMPDAEILSFSDYGIKKIEYEETESYQITSMFINHREQILNQLLK